MKLYKKEAENFLMNEVFLIGKVVDDVKFDFIINSKKISIANFTIETLDEQKIYIRCYDKLADFSYRNLSNGDVVFIYGQIIIVVLYILLRHQK